MRLELAGDRRVSEFDPAKLHGFELDPGHLATNHIVGFEQSSERAQPFVTLRAELLKHAREHDRRVFAVTSAQPGNGKTHVAVNLAAALSRITPTLLIELDLRRPSIATRLGLPPTLFGLDDFLAGEARWADIGVRVQGYDLQVYPARLPRDAIEELAGSPRLTSMLRKTSPAEKPAICIVDTSPVMIDDDFSRIAPAIDGVLMVAEEGRTPRRDLSEALGRIRPVPLVGTVLNKSITPRSGAADYSAYYRHEATRPGWRDRILGHGDAS